MDLSEQVLQKIHADGIRPVSPVWFWILRVALALWFVATVLMGAFAIALGLQALWPDLSPSPGWMFRRMSLGWLPLVWTLFAMFTGAGGYWAFRRFRYGYRTSSGVLLVGLLVAVVAGGMVLYASNGVFLAHRFLMRDSDVYRGLFEEQRKQQWSRIEDGRLSGVVVHLDSSEFELQDWAGRHWVVRLQGEEIGQIAVSDTVRVLGTLCGTAFCADRIMEWLPARHRGMGGRQGMGFGRKENAGWMRNQMERGRE